MNRQIVPSMLLSVLIVCFFAVILFERDSPKRSRGNARAAKAKVAGAEHVASDPHDTGTTPVTPRPADSKPQPKEEQKPEPGKPKGTAEQDVSPATQTTAGSSPAQAPSRAAAQDKPAPGPQADDSDAGQQDAGTSAAARKGKCAANPGCQSF